MPVETGKKLVPVVILYYTNFDITFIPSIDGGDDDNSLIDSLCDSNDG